MAEGLTLLSRMWRGDGVHQIGILKDGAFKNIPVKSIYEAEQKAKDFSAKGHEVYFACAEYQEEGKRTVSNATGAWGYWFDVDCGEEKALKGVGYATKKEAYAALLNFVKQAKLPNPDFLVDSGNGLHVYFCSDTFIPKSEWQINSKKLKDLTKHYNFLADDTRTADLASVLRFPDTFNYKNSSKPKLVKIIYPKVINE
ncbi:MAG: hypothetical protein V4545_00260 [Pseudomonadota bacterium]